MEELKGFQRKYLRGLAHKLNPSAVVGQKGLTPSLIEEIETALDASELIKVRFNDFKEKDQKKAITQEIIESTQSSMAGMIGHIVILYRPNKNKEKRQIRLLSK